MSSRLSDSREVGTRRRTQFQLNDANWGLAGGRSVACFCGKAVATSGGLLLLYGVGSVVGALAGALVMDAFEPATLFWYIAIIYVALAVFSLLRIGFKRPGIVGKKSRYIPMAKSPLTRVYRKRAKTQPKA